jgi:hypothetical protein
MDFGCAAVAVLAVVAPAAAVVLLPAVVPDAAEVVGADCGSLSSPPQLAARSANPSRAAPARRMDGRLMFPLGTCILKL